MSTNNLVTGLDASASSLVARVPQPWHGPRASARNDERQGRVDAPDSRSHRAASRAKACTRARKS